MKIYAKYPEGITKIIKEKEFYQTEDLSNTITVYVDRTNLTDITYTLTLEFLRADGRKTSLVATPFVAGEETTLEEDDITYDIHNFVLTETQLAVAGALAFTCYITIFNNDVMISRGALFNAINNVRKTVAYSTNTILVIDNDEEDVPVIVADMKNAIDILNGQLAGKVNKVDIVDDLTHTDSDKVLSANQGKVLNDAKADRDNTSQTIKAGTVRASSVNHEYNYRGTSLYERVYGNDGGSSIGDENYLVKILATPKIPNALNSNVFQWNNNYFGLIQFNDDCKNGYGKNNNTGLGLHVGTTGAEKPKIQLIPAFRYSQNDWNKYTAGDPRTPLIMIRPGFLFSDNYIHSLSEDDTYFGFDTDSTDNTKKDFRIVTKTGSTIKVDSNGVVLTGTNKHFYENGNQLAYKSAVDSAQNDIDAIKDGTTIDSFADVEAALSGVTNSIATLMDTSILDISGTKNAYINISWKQIMNQDDRRIVWYECKPNTLYSINKSVTSNKFVIGQSEVIPANGSYLINTPISVSGSTYTLISYNNANYLVIYYYDNDATDPDVILDSISVVEYNGAKDNYARNELNKLSNNGLTRYFKDGIVLSNNIINEWFSLAWDNKESLTEFDHTTTTEQYHTALKNLFDTYAWMGLSYENLGKDASNLYDIYGYHISKNLWSLDTNMKRPKLIIIACQHGFEKGGAFSLYYLVKYMIYNWKTNPLIYNIFTSYDISFIPIVNPWGWNETIINPSEGYVRERLNYNGVDLNRGYNENNLEPEQVIVKDFIIANKEHAVFFMDYHTNGDTITNPNFAVKNWLSLDEYTMETSKVKNLAFIWSTYFTQNVDVKIKNQIYQCNIITYTTQQGMAKNLADSYNIPSLTFEGCNKVYNEDELYEWTPTVQAYNTTQFINFINVLINYYSKIYNK